MGELLYCSSKHVPPMNCPTCQISLWRTLDHAIETYRCENCSGEWLHGAELDRLCTHRVLRRPPRQSTARVIPPADLARRLDCLRCETVRLIPVRWSGPDCPGDALVVDVCESCHGLWLDGGELSKARRLTRGAESRTHDADPWPPWAELAGVLVPLFGWM